MKCFTTDGKMIILGITVHRDPFPRIECGNNGRGRKLGYVGLKVADFESDSIKIERCSVRKTEKGYWQLIKDLPDDTENILVLVSIHGGFRGSAMFYSNATERVACNERKMCIYGSPTCPKCGAEGKAIYFPVSDTLYHPDSGEIETYKRWEKDKILGVVELASGHDAEGQAGMAGGPHEEKILVLKPGARIIVKKSGRLYGAPSVIHVRYDGPDSGLVVGTREQVYPEEYTS